MCNRQGVKKEQSASQRRKKLWEVNKGRHCSILGTCLTCSDLRRFAKKKIFQFATWASDFQIHILLVGFAATRNPKSRVIHKLLDERYRAAIKRYATAPGEAGALELWAQDSKRGAIAGAYWAIMTSNSYSRDMQTKVYGDLHMMGHAIVVTNQRQRKRHAELESKAGMLEEVLVSERQIHLRKQKDMASKIETFTEMEKNGSKLVAENVRISKKNIQLEAELAGINLSVPLQTVKKQLVESNERNESLCVEIEHLKRVLAEKCDLLDLASASSVDMTLQNAKLEESFTALQREVFCMENALLGGLDSSLGCSTCNDQNTNRCPGPDLCGKTILYVGGLHKMVSHYRKLVENHGGRFLHHDGGKEVSRAILPKMLSTADAVLCPIDCVSHDACTCVKKICKRSQKPYVMMRSSGLSSLAKGLTEIVQ